MVTHTINASVLVAQEPRSAPQTITLQPESIPTPPQTGYPVQPAVPPDFSPPSTLGPPTITKSDLIVIPPVSPEGPLLLTDVIASLYRAFPLIEIARIQELVARGEIQSALGAWDTKLEYYSLNQPLGAYETYRNGIGVARQTWYGGYIGAGYRVGRGTFEPWYKERETNNGGELKLALVQPLLMGRAIDPQRVELFQANLRQQAVGPEIQFQILVASRDAAFAYWDWVEQGNALIAIRELLDLALTRDTELRFELESGTGSELRVETNNVQIYERQLRYNYAQMKFRDASYKLALFLRDEQGEPRVPPTEWLPRAFPQITEIEMNDLEQALNNALNARPELALINFDIQQTRLDLDLARNQLLPQVDFTVQGAQDMGPRVSATNDKGEYELEAGITGGVPIQLNKARGKVQSLNAKLSQLAQKQEFFRNKVFTELGVARNQVQFAFNNVQVSNKLLRASQRVLVLFEENTESGIVEFLLLLEQEAKITESQLKLLEAERMYFSSLAAMQATLGLDPLDQAAVIVPQ